MHLNIPSSIALAGLISSISLPAAAVTVTATDLDSLSLGPTIVGPVGPTVDTTFITADERGIGDFMSSVSCPAGFTVCTPPTNPAGTIYTYRHQVTPGIDLPNDPPFPSPNSLLPLSNTRDFQLDFGAAGFNGVAGYSFSDAEAALNDGVEIRIEQLDDGRLAWRLPENSGWDTNESLTFFWQTTQSPSGPDGSYTLASESELGSAQGPLPVPVPFEI
ncbi:MAG: exosortase, PEP-CTERM interaction domain protein [Cyanobacteria bacterium P01_A01_bin.17]